MQYSYRIHSNLLLVVCCLSFGVSAAQAQDAVPAATPQSFPDSADGLQAQFAELIHTARSNDQSAFRAALESLGIPNADKWFAAHFEARFLPQLPQDYAKALSGYQSHVSWVMGNFAKFDDFALRVDRSETPRPLAETGFESLLPRPADGVKVENYRLTSSSSNPKHGTPSWVSSFVHADGRFRFVGGTYPFWAEKLSALRGPMSIPPALIHGFTVQGIAFQKDLTGPEIAAIVQLKVDINRDGRAGHIKVLSGQEPFVQDAKDYVKAADFGAMPNIPQLANARREWGIEVAFFKPKSRREPSDH
jgi:hypothetical protein